MQAFDSIKRLARGKRSPEGGFSLVEVLIAMSILSVGLMALAQMQIVAMQMNRSNTNRAEGEMIAQQQMETVINATWGVNGAPILALAGTNTVTRNNITYNVTTTVGDVVNSTRTVQVQVTYNDGRARTITFNTTKSQAEDPT